jgi:hypothetical protein
MPGSQFAFQALTAKMLSEFGGAPYLSAVETLENVVLSWVPNPFTTHDCDGEAGGDQSIFNRGGLRTHPLERRRL